MLGFSGNSITSSTEFPKIKLGFLGVNALFIVLVMMTCLGIQLFNALIPYTIAEHDIFNTILDNKNEFLIFLNTKHPVFKDECRLFAILCGIFIGLCSISLWRLPDNVPVKRFLAIAPSLGVSIAFMSLDLPDDSSFRPWCCNVLNFAGVLSALIILISVVSEKIFYFLFEWEIFSGKNKKSLRNGVHSLPSYTDYQSCNTTVSFDYDV